MYDLNFFRQNLDQIRERLATRGFALDVDAFSELDQKRRRILTESERLKAERNQATQQIGQKKRAGEDTTAEQQQVRALGERIAELDAQATQLENEFRDFLARIPNLPQPDVPVGGDERSNVEIRRYGTPPEFTFTPKAHWDLGSELGILDLERAAKVAGARFAVYWGIGARLERALINFMLDLHTREHGYTEVYVPYLVQPQALRGTGQLPKFEQDLFALKGEQRFYLIPTAEVPVTNLVREQIVSADDLPLKFVCHTPCFRSEAGAAGRDTRGMIRNHQFDKVELVHVVRPAESYAAREELTSKAETVLKKLDIPFRTVALSAGDIGSNSCKTYDLEAWLPGQNLYREISSCSNFEAFQPRRMQARLRNPDTGKPEPVHTLNGSGLAVGRTLVAVLENHQNADGSVNVPPALISYMGGVAKLTPTK
jgi:seryl-tRNA synthetase